tara:strand:+ start:430 stop:924 length:495 start_codon:yes stop_codon:yes gene_type:complete
MYWITSIERGQVDNILRGIRMGMDVNGRLPNGDTPLHVATRLGHIDAAHVLIVSGSNVHAKNGLGYSPIQTAARYNGSRDLLLMLLKFGCYGCEKDRRGRSALDYARAYGKHDIVHAYRVHAKWRVWARKRVLERECQFVYLVWNRIHISCNIQCILDFISGPI